MITLSLCWRVTVRIKLGGHKVHRRYSRTFAGYAQDGLMVEGEKPMKRERPQIETENDLIKKRGGNRNKSMGLAKGDYLDLEMRIKRPWRKLQRNTEVGRRQREVTCVYMSINQEVMSQIPFKFMCVCQKR